VGDSALPGTGNGSGAGSPRQGAPSASRKAAWLAGSAVGRVCAAHAFTRRAARGPLVGAFLDAIDRHLLVRPARLPARRFLAGSGIYGCLPVAGDQRALQPGLHRGLPVCGAAGAGSAIRRQVRCRNGAGGDADGTPGVLPDTTALGVLGSWRFGESLSGLGRRIGRKPPSSAPPHTAKAE
jgi:hypothetical protein